MSKGLGQGQPAGECIPEGPRVKGSVDNFLENLALVVEGMAGVLGHHCEIVLHDLRKPDQSIVAIANGHITGRKVGGPIIGGPLDDQGFSLLSEKQAGRSMVKNYSTRTRDGRTLKSSSVVFRNSKGAAVAALCANTDLSEFVRARELLGDICTVREDQDESEAGFRGEPGQRDVAVIIRSVVEESLAALGRPIQTADKEEKLKAIGIMQQKGLFLVKGGVDHAARALGVSRFTIYNYLKELSFRD